MCGIAGYVGRRQIEDERARLCLATMRRRGPDHEAAYRHSFGPDRHVLLLHSRLSIIDLDPRSNQPMRVGTRVIAYNGELYNYLEVRDALIARGIAFTTRSDTEVLVRALEQDGIEGLDRCEGMWALALYDEGDGSLLLVRDRFGEKPLHVYRDEDGIYFGSEIKQLEALRGKALAVNMGQVYRYLVNGYKSLYKAEETFFDGLREVPRAGAWRIDAAGAVTARSYWALRFEPDVSMGYEQAVKGVRERVIRAVELRLRADVPLAFCMSGGLDSNTLIAIARRVFGYDVHGFTIVSEDGRYDERVLVEQAVSELGIRHDSVRLGTERFLEGMEELIRQHDAPVYTISYYVHWLLCAAIARRSYRVSVSGTAADELLAGYYDHHNLYLYELRDSPGFAEALSSWQRHLAPVVRNPFLRNPRLYFERPDASDHIFLGNREFARYLVPGWWEDYAQTAYTPSPMRNRMLNELFHEAVPAILHEDDLNAMYFSIENRSPFLDRSLAEFCYRIPTPLLIQDGYGKAILRDAMAGIVPEPIRTSRRKVGFNANIHELLDVRNPAIRARLLGDSPIFEHVRRDRIEALLTKPELPNSESKFLFYFVCAKVFLESRIAG